MIVKSLLTAPEMWQTVQRLAGLGYDWHNVMHMIMGPVSWLFEVNRDGVSG